MRAALNAVAGIPWQHRCLRRHGAHAGVARSGEHRHRITRHACGAGLDASLAGALMSGPAPMERAGG